jgi:ATP-binding cassette subfamily D (ALD) long-chain fatty acid import protein
LLSTIHLQRVLSSGNILKPSLDLVLFTSQLSRSLGVRGTLLLFLNYYGTVAILRAVTPAFGRMAAIEARLEGEYRAGMGRVGREAEEVAFYDGGKRERDILTNAYMRLIKHVNSIYKVCFLFLIELDLTRYECRFESLMSGQKTT